MRADQIEVGRSYVVRREVTGGVYANGIEMPTIAVLETLRVVAIDENAVVLEGLGHRRVGPFTLAVMPDYETCVKHSVASLDDVIRKGSP